MEARARAAAALAAGEKQKVEAPSETERVMSARDADLAAAVHAHNAVTRPVSLVEMHTYTRTKAVPEESKKSHRKAFDPSTDLDLKRMDPSKREDMLKTSAGFNAKFAHGKKNFI
jgi:DNA-nicking Smr family endonuclease